jgi:hypothetical protein
MRIKIEQALLWCGIFGLALPTSLPFYYDSIPKSILEFFRGGNTGGVIIGILSICGFSGLCLYIFNMVKYRNCWFLRLCSCFIFFIAVITAGSMI